MLFTFEPTKQLPKYLPPVDMSIDDLEPIFKTKQSNL